MKPWTTVLLLLLSSVAVVLLVVQRNTIVRLREEIAQGRTESIPSPEVPAPIATRPQPGQQTDINELLRLRNEVSRLRATSNELATQLQEASNSFQFMRTIQDRNRSELRAVRAENLKLQAERQDPSTRPPSPPRVGAWLGLGMQDASQLAEVLGAKNGVLISNVVKGGPADRAKLKEADIILKIDGQEITGPSDFKAVLAQKPVGQPIILDLMRDKTLIQVQVTPREWPN